MASVVFEKQLANIKKGLELLHEMTQSMQELTDLSNENFMQKNIAQIQKANNELGNTGKKMKSLTQQSKKSFNFKPGIKSINALKLGLTAVGKLLDGIYQKTKMIVFAGIAAFAGIGFMASNQSKKNNQAKDIGLSPAKMLALENAGQIKAGDKSRYVESYRNIKTNATSNNASDFATLGLDYADFTDMSDPNQMFEVFNAKAQEINKMKGAESEHLREAFKNIVGHTTTEFYKAGAYTEYIEQHKQARNAGLDTLGGAGESFDRMLAQFHMTLTTIVSKLAPFITQISDAFNSGLKELMNNPKFQKMLQDFGNTMAKFGANLSEHIITFFENLPGYLQKIKEVFSWMFELFVDVAYVANAKWATNSKINQSKEKISLIQTEINKQINKNPNNAEAIIKQVVKNKMSDLEYIADLRGEDKKKLALSLGMSEVDAKKFSSYGGFDSYEAKNYIAPLLEKMFLNAHITINNADGSTNQAMQTIRLEGGSR